MTRTNLYGEPWDPPNPLVVNLRLAQSEFEKSGIAEYLPSEDIQELLNWLVERLETEPIDPDRLRLFHQQTGNVALFEFEYELQDERESSYYITKITRVD